MTKIKKNLFWRQFKFWRQIRLPIQIVYQKLAHLNAFGPLVDFLHWADMPLRHHLMVYITKMWKFKYDLAKPWLLKNNGSQEKNYILKNNHDSGNFWPQRWFIIVMISLDLIHPFAGHFPPIHSLVFHSCLLSNEVKAAILTVVTASAFCWWGE